VPTPGSYEVYIDGKRVSEGVGSSSTSDPQLLLGSITGLEMGPHTVTLVNSGVTGDILDLDRVETESVLTGGRCETPSLYRSTVYQNRRLVHPCLPQLSITPSTRFSGDLDGFLLRDSLLSTTVLSSTSMLRSPITSPDASAATRDSQTPR